MFRFVWSHPGIRRIFFSLPRPSTKSKSRGEKGEPSVERKAKLSEERKRKKKKRNKRTRTRTNDTEREWRSNRAKFASPDKALLDGGRVPSRVLPSTWGTERKPSGSPPEGRADAGGTSQGRAGDGDSRGSRWEPGLRPAAILRSRRVGPRHTVQAEEDKSTAPAKRPRGDLTRPSQVRAARTIPAFLPKALPWTSAQRPGSRGVAVSHSGETRDGEGRRGGRRTLAGLERPCCGQGRASGSAGFWVRAAAAPPPRAARL